PTISPNSVRTASRRDLFILVGAVAVAVLCVFVFDTGFIAEWIAEHKDSKVDEIIVVAFVLAFGLTIFSVRRWVELTRNLVLYEELHSKMVRLNWQSATFGELGDLLQSCLSSTEACGLITDRARILFPGTSGSVCITASSRDLVETIASW